MAKRKYTKQQIQIIRQKAIEAWKSGQEKGGKAPAKEHFPHFRYYKKSKHPALILKERNEDEYDFRRVTSSEFSGHHRNEKIDPNPDPRKSTPMYIVKRREHDRKKAFGSKYPWKYPYKK